jgi:hypothetical protein
MMTADTLLYEFGCFADRQALLVGCKTKAKPDQEQLAGSYTACALLSCR